MPRNPTKHPRTKASPADIRKFALRKTTKKGAYKPRVKKQFQKRRAPFVETKNRTHEELGLITAALDPQPSAAYINQWIVNPMPEAGLAVLNDDAYTVFIMQSFLSMSRGFQEDEMIGNSVYGRYLNAKFQFSFPQASHSWTVPVDLELIHGWITVPIANTIRKRVGTNPSITEELWTRANTVSYISEKVKDHFNERRDKLQWIPKQNTGVNILKRTRIRPNMNKSLSVVPTPVGDNGTTIVGTLPDVYKSLTWPIKRKVHYSTGASPAAEVQPAVPADTQEHCYPNHSWLPFVILFNPNFADIVDDGNDDTKIHVRFNNIFYYSDS